MKILNIGKWVFAAWVAIYALSQFILDLNSIRGFQSSFFKSLLEWYLPLLLLSLIVWKIQKLHLATVYLLSSYFFVWPLLKFSGPSLAGVMDVFQAPIFLSDLAFVFPFIHLLVGLILLTWGKKTAHQETLRQYG